MGSSGKIMNFIMGAAGKEEVCGSGCLKKEMMIEGSSDEEDCPVELEDSDDQSQYCSTTCTSPTSSSSSSSPDGPLFQLSDLMAQLPVKKGLSRYYQGKSQSHTSLASVKSVEDLVKNDKYKMNMKMKMKWCRSYGCFSPKATISKKGSSRTSTCVNFNSLTRK